MTAKVTDTPVVSKDPAITVAAGVAWLDENWPGWAGRIDLDTLDLVSSRDCVVCQAAGIANIGRALDTLGIDSCVSRWAIALGFLAPHWEYGPDWSPRVDSWYKAAEALWRAAIAERQAKGA